MTDLLALSVFGVDWQFLKPFIVIGLAFGGVYALSGVGLVVLYRATGVLNLAFGAIGAAGALIAYWLINHTSCPEWLAFTVCVLFGGVLNLAYGVIFGPAFARRDPLVKMMGTLALALILLGIMGWRAPAGGAFARFLPLPSSEHHYFIAGTSVNLTQIISVALALAITVAVTIFLRFTRLGTAMRALANDREITATLGVPVRRVEAAAWFGSGLACGAAGLLLPDLLTSLDYAALTFLVIASLAAALIGRLQSLWATLFGGLAVGLAQSVATPYASISAYRSAQKEVPEIAKDIFFTPALKGPRGTGFSCEHVIYSYIVPQKAKNIDNAKKFLLHLVGNYDQAMYYSELYNSPAFFDAPIPSGDRGYQAVKGAKSVRDLHNAWFTDDPFALPGEEKGKLAVLKDAEKWSTNLGHPGPANPAEGEVFATFVVPNMFANAARGMKPETAVEQATLLTKTIFAKWRKKGLVGGKV